MSTDTMRKILREYGVELRHGVVDEDDAASEVETASDLEFDERSQAMRSESAV